MSRVPSRIESIIGCTCPKCRHDKVFKYGAYEKLFDMAKTVEMHERCGHCGFQYEIEPGFFWASMYVSYALVVGIFLGALALFVIFWFDLWLFIGGTLLFLALTLPMIIRYSRILLLQIFGLVKFEKSWYHNPPSKAEQQAITNEYKPATT